MSFAKIQMRLQCKQMQYVYFCLIDVFLVIAFEETEAKIVNWLKMLILILKQFFLSNLDDFYRIILIILAIFNLPSLAVFACEWNTVFCLVLVTKLDIWGTGDRQIILHQFCKSEMSANLENQHSKSSV